MTETPQSGSGAGAPIGDVPLPPGYELVGRLGSGGFATVWLAEQARLGRRVAVKVLGGSLSDAERERRFVAECRAIGRLSGHPSVVTVHDAGTTDAGRPYLVMEHLPGGSLQDRLAASGPLPWPEAVEAAVCVGDALAAAHEAGILHRDVKPANVLLDAEGHPRLGDFGIARLAEGTHTATGTVVGTLAYTPPEVLSGERPTPAADIWSLGATLHALLSGRSPFGAASEEAPAAVIARVLRGEVAPLPPSVPDELRALVADCLRTDPADRPQSVVAVVARLHAAQVARSLPPTPARAARPPAGGTSPPPPPPVGALPPPPPPASTAPPPAPPPARPSRDDPDGPTVHDPRPDPPTVAAPPPPTPPPAAATAGRRRSRAPLVAVGGLVAVLALVVAAVVLWPDGGGDDVAGGGGTATTTTAPVRTAIDGTALSLVAAAGSAPSPVWDVPFPCAEGCAGAGSEDLVVMASATGEVVALDPAADDGDGAVVWRVDVEGATGVPQVVLAGDLALVEVPLGEAIHRLVALDAASGDARWEAELPGLVRGGVLGEPGDPTLVVMGSDPDDETPDGLDVGSTHVVDVGIGLLWSTLGHPAGVTDDIVVVSDGASLTGHDRRSGSERWSAEVQTGPLVATQALPRGVVAGDVLVAVAGLDAVGLDPADGSERWRTALPARAAPDAATGVVAAATPEGGTAALVGGPEGLVALDPTDGTLLWDVGGGAPVTGDGALLTWVSTHDAVVVGLEGGTLAARDLGDGTTVASATVDDVRQWALLDGQVLARTDGAVVAHDVPGLAPAWEVPVPAQAIVAAPRGFVAATGDAATRYEAPA